MIQACIAAPSFLTSNDNPEPENPDAPWEKNAIGC